MANFKLTNPWARNPWFETVAEAQRRAKRRLTADTANADAGVKRGKRCSPFRIIKRYRRLRHRSSDAP